MRLRKTQAEWISEAAQIHNHKYDYSLVSYAGAVHPITILCPSHGPFTQIARDHLRGRGCPGCAVEARADNRRIPVQEWIARAKVVHGDKYDYSRVQYNDITRDNVIILCPEHGEFVQTPKAHVNGQGCPQCGRVQSARSRRLTTEEWVSKALNVHGFKYDYSRVTYTTSQEKVTIVCPDHGEFNQVAAQHLSGKGCPKCGFIKGSSTRIKPVSEWVARAVSVHGERYDYSGVVYDTRTDKVDIVCPVHGPFRQIARDHIQGKGCPRCANVGPSSQQVEIAEFLSGLTKVEQEYTIPGTRKRLDIFLPDLNIGVEYHGLIWHSEKFSTNPRRDYDKHRVATEAGIRVIHIYEDEWIFRGHVVKAMLRSAIGRGTGKVYARKCSVVLVNPDEALAFLEDNHIQGDVNSPCAHYGLHHEGDLVGLMSFSRVVSIRGTIPDTSIVELRRYATSTSVVGGASKLLSAYLREHPEIRQVISYSDNRMYSGAMYEKLGFTRDTVSAPSYSYFRPSEPWREPKYRFTRAKMEKRQDFNFDPELTEAENARNNGWFRIYDCGKTKWVLTVR